MNIFSIDKNYDSYHLNQKYFEILKTQDTKSPP